MTYEQLPIVEVDLDELLLDLENYRIPTRRADEASALKYLFASEDVLGAARLIIRNGYFDNEVPIVIAATPGADGSPYIVLEGNRRVSALKALRDPNLVPGHESELRALLKRYAVEAQNLPYRIRVIVAPDRASAAPHVARLHTGISKKRWSRDQQATFYYSLLDDQTTVDDVKAQYPGVEVVRFMRMAVTRRFLMAVPFADASLREYAASDALSMSAFEYAYRNKHIAAAIGAAFDNDGQLLPRDSTPEKTAASLPPTKLNALEFLIGEFRANRLNTRSKEFGKDTKERDLLLARLNEFLMTTRQSSSQAPGSSDPTDDTDGGQRSRTSDPSTPRGAPRGPNHPDTKDTLDLSGMPYEDAPLNLKLRYHELREISLSRLPTATAILMRSILESTIKIHFESSEMRASGELSEVFKKVNQSYRAERPLRAIIDSIQSGGTGKPGSIQWFNLIAHSADASTTAADVRQAWKVVNPLLRHLLRGPSQRSPDASA